MTEDFRTEKVEILIRQKKYPEAELILTNLMREDATNIHFLSLLAQVYLQQDKLDNASNIINTAIGLAPDYGYLFYIKARIAIQKNQLREAENLIGQAIAIDPYDADYFALFASIKLGRKKYVDALEIANEALAIDAENLLALNVRSTTLIKLNRSEESFETIKGALREDPNNAYTHANYGWNLLEKGDHKKALEHLKESLSNDPTYEYAQSGMLEALKATNPVYRLFLKYAIWMSNLSAKYQYGVIIGFYIGFRLLRTVAEKNEALRPYLTPLIVALAIIAFSTWIISPVSNLFLRFHKYGQLLLDKNEKMSSNFVAASFGVFMIGLLLYFVSSDEKMLAITAYGFAMMLPFGVMFSTSKNKYVLLAFTAVLAIVGLIAISFTFSTGDLFNTMSFAFVIGFVAFQWITNFMLIKEDNQ